MPPSKLKEKGIKIIKKIKLVFLSIITFLINITKVISSLIRTTYFLIFNFYHNIFISFGNIISTGLN